MDPLSTLLSAASVEGVIYGRLEARAPWGVQFPPSEHVAFGTVLRGNGWLLAEGDPQALAGGDCFLVRGEHGFSLRDHPAGRARDIAEIAGGACTSQATMELGGMGAACSLIAGCFRLDLAPASSGHFLRDLLPAVTHVGSDRAVQFGLNVTLGQMAAESAGAAPGRELALARLAEVLLVQMLRAHAAQAGCRGWLQALADPQIGRALQALHADLAAQWTVESLAAAAAMSRSAFAARFKQVLGEAPLEYLTRWRMLHAGRLLRAAAATQATVAQQVGYESESAFNRAFKRTLGVTPGSYRTTTRDEVSTSLQHS